MLNLKLGYKHKRKPRYAFFVEAKGPNKTSIYQADDDYVRLMKQMKTSIGIQVDMGFQNPKSLGLLVESWRCKLYSMKLVEEAIYLPAMIKRFWLVEKIEQVISILSTVEGVMLKESLKNSRTY
ncbi:uncharacterized protein RHIMIDRAFT_279396 [Rhizopus microsporus ATCC 52813]|uniref:Uncharacterized protein n=1 Tax=Rhizopus microsporus ATCC 52813 TaxID=1340429 RepID=A0A2G4SXF2_RHIZD|nr:uncharacterized protein RHIMIDRAFT_279396 [Rhizopus microsporus ATCC 52813]PHZ13449.1 hypothetical protein RHIMIDRAFT_279396 [Rhizopus microsporus ATCC 52813]